MDATSRGDPGGTHDSQGRTLDASTRHPGTRAQGQQGSTPGRSLEDLLDTRENFQGYGRVAAGQRPAPTRPTQNHRRGLKPKTPIGSLQEEYREEAWEEVPRSKS